MTPLQASLKASELFGVPSFARHISHRERNKRYVVGILGPVTSEPWPLGLGATWDEAFQNAADKGCDAEWCKAFVSRANEQLEKLEMVRRLRLKHVPMKLDFKQ